MAAVTLATHHNRAPTRVGGVVVKSVCDLCVDANTCAQCSLTVM